MQSDCSSSGCVLSSQRSVRVRQRDLQTPAVCSVGSSTRCFSRGIQHFGQHLDRLSPRWNSNTAVSQTGSKDFAVRNVTTFPSRCSREAAQETGGKVWWLIKLTERHLGSLYCMVYCSSSSYPVIRILMFKVHKAKMG